MANTARGWPYPVGTDLVVDGDNAIKALADKIDAQLGLTLLSTKTFSGATDAIVDGVFSTLYSRFRIAWQVVHNTGNVLQMQMRTGGVTNVTSNYGTTRIRWTGTAVAGDFNGSAAWTLSGSQLESAGFAEFTALADPALKVVGHGQNGGIGPSSGEATQVGLNFGTTQAFDGIRLLPGAGTFTGVMQIYGYR